MNKIFFTSVALLLTFTVAVGSATGAESPDWEINITAVTETGLGNKISIGQNNSASNGFDGYFDTPARVEGDLQVYIDNSHWNEHVKKYWRDIKASDDFGSWTFHISTKITNTDITLSWNNSKISSVSAVTLKNNDSGATVDMKSENSFTYSSTGPTTFTVTTTPNTIDSRIFLNSTRERRQRH